MWKWEKRKIKVEVHEPIYCSVCEEETTDPSKDFPLDRLICKKCREITLIGGFPKEYVYGKNLIEEWSYIWDNGIKDNGLEWYKKARDKLIKKLRAKREKIRKEEEKANLLIKQKIDNWS